MLDIPVGFLPDPHYPSSMESRIAVLEHIAKTTAATLERLEQRQDQLLDWMDRRFDAIDRRFETMDRKFEAKFEVMGNRWVALNIHHRQDFLWLIAIQVATVGGLLTAMARGFHWL
jgi:hypothetical protein